MQGDTPHAYSEDQQALRAFKDALAAVWGALERAGERGAEFFEEVERAEQAYACLQELAPARRPVEERIDEFLDPSHRPERMTLVYLLADLDYEYYLREHLAEGIPLNPPRGLSVLTETERERWANWNFAHNVSIALLERLEPAYDVSYYWPPGSEPPGV